MKKIFLFTLVLIQFLLAGSVFSQSRQYMAGAEASYMIPQGKLKDQFKPAAGMSIYWGKQTSSRWTWLGRLEYFKFTNKDEGSFSVQQKVLIGLSDVMVKAPVKNLSISLEVSGLSLNAKYNLFRTDLLESNLDLGFGVYRWTYKRGAIDSVYTDTSAAGEGKYYSLLKNVPSASRSDWSGGFHVGAEFCVNVTGSLSFTAAAAYKNVMGEIWPALALELENVSSFQMIELKAGLRYKF